MWYSGSYVINLAEYKSIWIHWIALYVNGNNNGIASYDPAYFDSFGVKQIPEGIKKIIGNINIITNINRIQSYDRFDNV